MSCNLWFACLGDSFGVCYIWIFRGDRFVRYYGLCVCMRVSVVLCCIIGG